MDWPSAAVIIAIVFAVMVISTTFVSARYSKHSEADDDKH